MSFKQQQTRKRILLAQASATLLVLDFALSISWVQGESGGWNNCDDVAFMPQQLFITYAKDYAMTGFSSNSGIVEGNEGIT